MGFPYFTIDETNAVVVAAAGTSASATIPAGFERIGVVAATNVHWRMGKGAQTAIATDPMITNAGGMFIVKVKPTGSGLSDTIAFIQDTATGNVSVFGIRES
jgi:hypothetical protein